MKSRAAVLRRLLFAAFALLAGLLLARGYGRAPADFAEHFDGLVLPAETLQIDMHPDCSYQIIHQPLRDKGGVLAISAPMGKRCEIVPRIFPFMADKFFREPFNVPRRYTFSVAVTSLGTGSRTTKRGRNTIVAQWHASPDPFPGGEPNRSPPLALRIHNGKWAITFGSEPKFRSTEQYLANNWRYVGAVQENEWITWDFRLRWGYRGEGSYTEVWKNGELVFLLEEPNAFNDIRGVYLKLGLYHPPSDQRLLMDDIVIDGAGRLGD